MSENEDATLALDLEELKKQLSSLEKEALKKPASLLAVGGELNGMLFDLDKAETVLGRSADCTIPLETEGISRKHAKIAREGDENFTLQDLGSKNGTFLNNNRLSQKVSLNKGDLIKLGNISFKYLPKGDTERLAYDKLNLEANTDKHTGCFNKAYLNKSLEAQVGKCKLTGKPLSLIIFDLDHFKKLNDNYGHDAGDFVLKQAADLIRKNGVRERMDVFARYGGEEFCILLPETPLKIAYGIAERLRKLIAKHSFMYEEQRLPVTMSCGLSDYREGVTVGSVLFKRADEALYKSKEGGRNRVSFYKS